MGQATKSGKYEGTLPLKGWATVLSWSELVNFLLDLEKTDKLEFTAWFDVNPALGYREISISPLPHMIRVE